MAIIHRNQKSSSKGNSTTKSGLPGKGTASRGRGDAPITWGKEAEKQGFKFSEMKVPQGVPDREGELLKTKLAAPIVDPKASKGRSAAREINEAGRGEAWKQKLRPRHRDVIKKYFDSKGDK